MKKYFVSAVVSAAAGILVLSSTAFAEAIQENNGPGEQQVQGARPASGDWLDNIGGSMGLSAEQNEKLMKQREEFKAKVKDLRSSGIQKRSELKKELEKEKADKAKVDSLVEEIKNIMGEQLRRRVDSIFAIEQVLTPEQSNILRDYNNKRDPRQGPAAGSNLGGW